MTLKSCPNADKSHQSGHAGPAKTNIDPIEREFVKVDNAELGFLQTRESPTNERRKERKKERRISIKVKIEAALKRKLLVF